MCIQTSQWYASAVVASGLGLEESVRWGFAAEKDFRSWGAERQAEETAEWTGKEGLRLREWRQHEGDHTDTEGKGRRNLDWNRSSIWSFSESQWSCYKSDVVCRGASSHERVTRGDEGGCVSAVSFVQLGKGGPMFLPTLSGTDSMISGRDAVKSILSFTFCTVGCLWVSDALRRPILWGLIRPPHDEWC